jgi:hypothetical protein
MSFAPSVTLLTTVEYPAGWTVAIHCLNTDSRKPFRHVYRFQVWIEPMRRWGELIPTMLVELTPASNRSPSVNQAADRGIRPETVGAEIRV